MKAVKIIVLIFVSIMITIFIYSFFLPSEYLVQRNIQINTNKEIVFIYINTLHYWEDWSSWTVKNDSTLKISYIGPDSGKGATQLWKSGRMGEGSIKITNSIYPDKIEYIMKMGNGDEQSKGEFILKKKRDRATELKWIIKGEVSWNPIAKIFSYFYMDSFMGPDLERALKNLKELAEIRRSIVESL
jgi:hypothetical protein